MNYKTELLAPAGSKESLDAALGEGADAVYLGLRDFNARTRAKNFSYKEFEAAVEKIHEAGKKIYVALNTVVEERESKAIYNILKYLSLVGPDAVIVQDLGVVRMINEYFPDMKIHASTQMNIGSSSGVNLMSKYGVKRVVLSRELDFGQIKSVRENTNLELEIFAHGALCISASGLCLFSSYIGGRSANRGTCAQPCRKLYSALDKTGYYFSPRDLMLIQYVPEIIESGINSIKLEGRMRNAAYVSTIVRAYRHVIDNYEHGKNDAVANALEILQNDFARSKTSFYFSRKSGEGLIGEKTTGGLGIYLGKIREVQTIDGRRYGVLKTGCTLEENDTIRINAGRGSLRQNLKISEPIKNEKGILISIPDNAGKNDDAYLTVKRELALKYKHILPKSLNRYKRHPGNNEIPRPKKTGEKFKNSLKRGFYIKIGSINDIFITQAFKPEKLIIELKNFDHSKIIGDLKSTAYNPEDIIISLDPFFIYTDEKPLAEAAAKLSENGFKYFVANNTGHISILKNNGLNIIAGPFLYAFNGFALDFLENLGASYFIDPVESSKDNLLKTWAGGKNRDRAIIQVFAYPGLFRIQTDLFNKYSFSTFSDKYKNNFNIIADNGKTIVIPERPFSIIDKIAELKRDGFGKFLVDMSYIRLNKNIYKSLYRAAATFTNPPNISRFNWKDGFSTDKKKS